MLYQEKPRPSLLESGQLCGRSLTLLCHYPGHGGAAAESGQEEGNGVTLGNARKCCMSCNAEVPCSPVNRLSYAAGGAEDKATGGRRSVSSFSKQKLIGAGRPTNASGAM